MRPAAHAPFSDLRDSGPNCSGGVGRGPRKNVDEGEEVAARWLGLLRVPVAIPLLNYRRAPTWLKTHSATCVP
jgi:hypothetical protein